jgi:hypothetical protein
MGLPETADAPDVGRRLGEFLALRFGMSHPRGARYASVAISKLRSQWLR